MAAMTSFTHMLLSLKTFTRSVKLADLCVLGVTENVDIFAILRIGWRYYKDNVSVFC